MISPLSRVDSSTRHIFCEMVLSREESRFEQLGNDLKDAMSTYVTHLKRERLPMPSFAPSSGKNTSVKHPDGVASKLAILELAQQICSMTMDPAMNLLISSLQVCSFTWNDGGYLTKMWPVLVSFLFVFEGSDRPAGSHQDPQTWTNCNW